VYSVDGLMRAAIIAIVCAPIVSSIIETTCVCPGGNHHSARICSAGDRTGRT
jgi:hypothetical protein